MDKMKEVSYAAQDNEFSRSLNESSAPSASEPSATSAASSSSPTEEASGPPVCRVNYHLDDVVSVWSDFSNVRLHAKSSVMDLLSSPSSAFTNFYTEGSSESLRRLEDSISSSIHFFLEDSDNLQGSLTMVDFHSALGGVVAKLLTDLHDELRTPMVVFPASDFVPSVVEGSLAEKANVDRFWLNAAQAFSGELFESSSVIFPILTYGWTDTDFPLLAMKPRLRYHSSAVCAAALDAMLWPIQDETAPAGRKTLTDIQSALVGAPAMRLCGVHAAVPFPLQSASGSLVEQICRSSSPFHTSRSLVPLWTGLERLADLNSRVRRAFTTCVWWKGFERAIGNGHVVPSDPGRLEKEVSLQALNSTTCDDVALAAAAAVPSLRSPSVFNSRGASFVLADTFPHFTSARLSAEGSVLSTASAPAGATSDATLRLPVAAVAQSSSDIGSLLLRIATEVESVRYDRFEAEYGLISDDWKECLERLLTLAADYRNE